MPRPVHRGLRIRPFAFVALLALVLSSDAAAEDLLPDMITVPDVLGEVRIDTRTIPGRRLLRLSNSTPNIGRGRLEIRASRVVSATQQEVVQRIYRSDGSSWDRFAGTFTYHSAHRHVHFDGWSAYRLRTITTDRGVGEVVAEGVKASFCLLDLFVHDVSNPFIEFPPRFTVCGFEVQGITPGWTDIYDRELPDQWIDITDVPDGFYWLEAAVDPQDNVLEEDESNNASRIVISIGAEPPAEPDRYEENDSREEVDAREDGAPNSPNLGLLNTRLELDELSMDDTSDYFKFRLGRTGEPGSFVRIESPYVDSDLDLAVVDGQGLFVGTSTSLGNLEQVSLEGQPPGDYYCWVLSFLGENPGYRLILDPAANGPPQIEVTGPAPPRVWVERAFGTVPVDWIATDPEGDLLSVSLFIDRDPSLDKGTLALLGYQDLEGESGLANVNTAGLDLGEWFLYAEVSDGRGRTGDWAPGSFVLYVKGDVDFDGNVDRADWRRVIRALWQRNFRRSWDHILDMDRDGELHWRDLVHFWRAVIEHHRHDRAHDH